MLAVAGIVSFAQTTIETTTIERTTIEMTTIERNTPDKSTPDKTTPGKPVSAVPPAGRSAHSATTKSTTETPSDMNPAASKKAYANNPGGVVNGPTPPVQPARSPTCQRRQGPHRPPYSPVWPKMPARPTSKIRAETTVCPDLKAPARARRCKAAIPATNRGVDETAHHPNM